MLLTNMAYAEDDEEVIAAEDEEINAGREDRDQDIRPSFRGQKDRGDGGLGGGGEDGGEEDEYGYDDEDESQWNLRKSSANGLDVMSNVFGDELLGMILPIVEQRFREQDWRPSLSPPSSPSAPCPVDAPRVSRPTSLSSSTSSCRAWRILARCSARRRAGPSAGSVGGWCSSRLRRASGRSPPPTADQGRGFVEKILGGLLRRVGDRNKHVQAAACGALATFIAEAREDIQRLGSRPSRKRWRRRSPRTNAKTFAARSTPSPRSRRAPGTPFETPRRRRLLLPPLELRKWEEGGDAQPDLYQLLECVTSVVTGVGLGAQEYAAPVFARALNLARAQLAQRELNLRNPEVPYEADHVICAIDLLSGVADGMGPGAEALVGANAAPLLEVLVAGCADQHSPGVRRSAFALVGDVAKGGGAAHLRPVLPTVLEHAAKNLEPKMVQAYNMGACNNACWSSGEARLASSPEEFAPYVQTLGAAFARVLSTTMIQRSLGENAAIALGRFALRCPEQLARGFGDIVGPWCGALRRLRDGTEGTGVRGFGATRAAQPGGRGEGTGGDDERHRELAVRAVGGAARKPHAAHARVRATRRARGVGATRERARTSRAAKARQLRSREPTAAVRTGATMKEEGKKVETETGGGEDPRRGGEGGDASTRASLEGGEGRGR